MVNRLCQGISALSIDIGLPGQSIKVTVSAGVTLLDPNYPVEQTIDRADKAMYAAKTAGRNCTKTWSMDM